MTSGSRPGSQDGGWMFDLPYEKVHYIRQAILTLEGLVAVLSQRNGPRLLHVYLAEPLPDIKRAEDKVISLHQLQDRDLSEYDGLLVGFTVLDLLRDDLMTKGPYFYPIERIYVERGEVALLYQTQANLSIELMKHLHERGDHSQDGGRLWAEARALVLALPFMLQGRFCEKLVAILPVGELNRFILRKTCKYVYSQLSTTAHEVDSLALDDLRGMNLDTNQHWIVSLEEAALFCPNVDITHPRFIELRSVLRNAGLDEALQSTRKSLAAELLAMQERIRSRGLLVDGSSPYLPAACAILAEYWLSFCELDDLVAFSPHNDFTHFAETGDSIRIYRVLNHEAPSVGRLPGKVFSLQQCIRDGLPDGYGNVIFTFPLVRNLLLEKSTGSAYGLSDILWKMGKIPTLARSLWLTSLDIIQEHGVPGHNSQAFLNMLLDSTLRASSLYSLEDPWRWRQGRWRIYLEESYHTVHLILQRLVEDLGHPLSLFYRALSIWYECGIDENLANKIRSILDLLREFERYTRDRQRHYDELHPFSSQCRQLLEITEGLSRMPFAGLVIESKNVPSDETNLSPQGWERIRITSGIRKIINFAEPLPLISSFFRQSWHYLLNKRRWRQQLYSRERDIDRLTRQYESILRELREAQRRLFAPAHELRILSYAYQQEIDHIEVSLRELETSAKLAVDLRNQWVDLHKEVLLTIDVINQGRVEAGGLEVILTQSRGVQLLDETLVREIAVLKPGEAAQIHYNIRPEQELAELRLEYTFQDRYGQPHKDILPLRLNVRNLDEGPFQVKVNRYQFGRPIQEPTEFYGRRSELQNIVSQLIAGGKQNLLLRGPRRMGKTSLMYMLKRVLTEPAARRFFNLPTSWDDRLDRVHPVFLSLHSFNLQSGSEAVNQFFRTLIEQAGLALGLCNDDLAGLLEAFERRERDFGVVNAALEQIKRILDSCPAERIAVLLDEYDEVYRPENGNLDRYLREFVSAEQRLTWIIASTMALFREVKTISSPWFNVFSILELNRLSEEAAVALVEKPCQDEMVFWRSDAVLSLLNETGRHPAFTQLFCAKVISNLNKMRTNYVLSETIVTAAEEIVDEQETANSHFEFYWQDTSGVGQLILLILDDSETPLSRKELHRRVGSRLAVSFGSLPNQRVLDLTGDPISWQDREFKTSIEFVEKIVNAVTLDSQRRYVFTVPLFQRWLRRRRRFIDLMAEAVEKVRQEMEEDGIIIR